MSCIDGHKFCVPFDYEKPRFHTCPKSSNRLLICRPDGQIATVSPQGPRLPPCLAKIATPILPPRDCHSKIATPRLPLQDCHPRLPVDNWDRVDPRARRHCRESPGGGAGPRLGQDYCPAATGQQGGRDLSWIKVRTPFRTDN